MTEEEKLKEQELAGGETESAKVKLSAGVKTETTDYDNTMTALRQAEKSLPTFSGSYDEEINRLYSKIVNRTGFRYSPANDPMYSAYREQFTREGGLAMRDSMGQAAALTGGYGSSYGEVAGQQQYNAYLQKLNEVLPELYSQAYEIYENEGEQLQSRLNAATELAGSQYDRYRDRVDDARYVQSMDAQREQTEYDRGTAAFNMLMELIAGTGYQPTEEELTKAGMNQAQAEALRNEYLRVNRLRPAASSGNTAAKVNTGYSSVPVSTAGVKEATKIAATAAKAETTNKTRR